tara:strand:- start:2491 stop:4233 length:1743 start_codon:yes stop_codon:yes gene_type:complete
MTGQFNAADNKISRGIAGGIYRNTRIGSFKIGKNEATDLWYLLINQQRLIGTEYPSQDHALSVLHGIFTSNDGSTAGMNAVIAQMVARGTGIIEADATIGTVTISGDASMDAGQTKTYTAAFDGTATDATYSWSSLQTGTASTSFSTTTAASTNVTLTGNGSVTLTCTVSSASSSDSPSVDTHAVSVTANSQTNINPSGIPGAVGVLSTSNLSVGDNGYDDIGLLQINTVNNASATFYFWSPRSRDRFKEMTYFDLEGTSIDPSSKTFTELAASSSLGFGLLLSDATLGTTWTTALNAGSNVDIEYSTTNDSMQTIQIVKWASINTSAKTATVTTEVPDVLPSTEVIEDSQATSLLVGKSNKEPILFNGSAADAYGASSGTFPQGGHSLSDNTQCDYYWSKFQIQMSTPANPLSSVYQWDETEFPLAANAQQNKNQWTAGSWKHISNGDSVRFKVYHASPLNNRQLLFTVGSNLQDAFTSVIPLAGPHELAPGSGFGYTSGGPHDHKFTLDFTFSKNSEGLLEWMTNNQISSGADAQLWFNGSKESDLTAAIGAASDEIIFTRTDGEALVAGRTYELRHV